MEGLCVNLIFGTRGQAWIYSADPTGVLSIAVPLSVRPLSHTHICVYIIISISSYSPTHNQAKQTDGQTKKIEMNLCVRKQTNGIALFFMTFLPSLPFWAIFNDNHGVFLLFPCYFLSKKVISAINKKKCLEIIFINFKFKFTRPQARGDCEKPDQARVHLKKCVCDCRQAGDSFRSCYNEKPL